MPFEIVVNAADFFGVVDALENYPKRQVQQIANAFQELGAELVPVLQGNTPIGSTGDLATSTKAVVNILGLDVALSVIQPATNLYGEVYQDYVVTGRPPGRRPPFEALEGWVEFNWGSTEPEDVYKLMTHIGQHGTQPSFYVFNTLEQSKELIDEVAKRLGINLTIALWEDYTPQPLTD